MNKIEKMFKRCIDKDGYKICIWFSRASRIEYIIQYLNEYIHKYDVCIQSYMLRNVGNIHIYFKNGSLISIYNCKENRRGHRFHYALVENDVGIDVLHALILPTLTWSYELSKIYCIKNKFIRYIATQVYRLRNRLLCLYYHKFTNHNQHFDWFDLDDL